MTHTLTQEAASDDFNIVLNPLLVQFKPFDAKICVANYLSDYSAIVNMKRLGRWRKQWAS